MATQQDVDDALNDLNETIQKTLGLPPIKAVPDVLAKPPATQADVDAALKDFNDTVEAKKGPVAQTPKEPEQPARPDALPYIGGQAKIGFAQGGNNMAASQQAELYSMGLAPPPDMSSPSTDLAAANKEVYGGNGQVVAPDRVSRYLGAGANALASNPLAAIAGGPGTVLAGVGGAIGGGMGSMAGEDFADAYLPDYLKPYASILGGVLGGGVGAAAPFAAGAAGRAVRPPAPPVKGLTPYKPEVTTAYYHDPFSFDNVPIRNADGSSTYPENHPSLNPDGTLKARPPKAIPTDLLYDAQMTPAMLDDAHPRTMAVEKALRSDPRTTKAFDKIDTTNDLAMKKALDDIEVQSLKPDISKVVDQNGRLDADKMAAHIAKLKSDGNLDNLPADHQDILRLNHVSDLLNRQSRLESVTPSNLSKEGVNALRRYIGGDPSWIDFATPQALSLIATHGDPHIANLLATVPYATKLVAGPRVAATNRVRNDQAVKNLLQEYTHQ